MKNYIKPTFTLAGLFPMALAASCTIADDEMEFLESFFQEQDWSKMFVDSGDDCAVDSGIDFFCKHQYALGNNDIKTVFNSF